MVFSPQDFIAKLAALIPPFRVHQVRYHGVLAPNASWRARVVPRLCEGAAETKYNRTWAELMKRVFDVDVLQCACGGRLVFLSTLMERDVIRAILKAQGLPADPPERVRDESIHYEHFWESA